MARSVPIWKILRFAKVSLYLERFVPRHATAHMCAESNDWLKIVTQLFTRWWNRPTGVVLQGRASNHHKVLW